MPTSPDAFAAVAATLGHVNPGIRDEVQAFFRDAYPAMPEPARDLISDFLFAAETLPTGEALGRLREAVEAIAVLDDHDPRHDPSAASTGRRDRATRATTVSIRIAYERLAALYRAHGADAALVQFWTSTVEPALPMLDEAAAKRVLARFAGAVRAAERDGTVMSVDELFVRRDVGSGDAAPFAVRGGAAS